MVVGRLEKHYVNFTCLSCPVCFASLHPVNVCLAVTHCGAPWRAEETHTVRVGAEESSTTGKTTSAHRYYDFIMTANDVALASTPAYMFTGLISQAGDLSCRVHPASRLMTAGIGSSPTATLNWISGEKWRDGCYLLKPVLAALLLALSISRAEMFSHDSVFFFSAHVSSSLLKFTI